MDFQSKLPKVGTTIFSVMSALAKEHQAINLSQGFPNFDCSPRLRELVTHYMNAGFNQYAPMAGVPKLCEQIAEKAAGMYGAKVNAATDITITAGATQAIFTAITAFVRAGDEVIIIEPAYDCYRPAIEVNGGIAKAHRLVAPDYQIDWGQLRKLVNIRTRMIIINTPHNPTGKTLKASDMQALKRIVNDTDILILSDEVYEHLIFDGEKHESILRYPELWQRTIATYSFGKTFHNTGWKLGYCIAPENLMKEFRKVHQFNVFSVNTPMQYALADFMERPEEYLGLPQFYQQKRDFFLEGLEASRLYPITCEGTYFQLCDYSRISDEKDTDFAKRMTTDYGVAAIPVSAFYSVNTDAKVIRLCFAKTEETLMKAMELIGKM